MQAAALGCALFVDAVSVFAESITSELISQRTQEVLREHPEVADKIVAYISDNAANFKAAWRLLQQALPSLHIVFGCLAHGLNLFLKVICGEPSRDKLCHAPLSPDNLPALPCLAGCCSHS